MPLAPGTLLNNRYRVVSILGQGGMGAVYRATDEHLSISVAVKENLFLTDEYSRQFQREARILASLRHPGLPHVADYFVLEAQGQYLVMDYIEGEDLRQRLERTGPLPEREVILIGISVCDALNYLHTSEPAIIHRDLKPGNIKVTAEGQAVLVDFGLAKIIEGGQATLTGARAMTPGYSPPEQYGTASTDARSDIYSLGATLYAALTGVIPEDGLNRMTGKADLTDIRSLNPKVSRRLAETLERAMEVDPDDRFQTAEEYRQALIDCGEMASYFRERPTISPPPSDFFKGPASATGGERVSTGEKRKSRPSVSNRRRKRQANGWVLVPFMAIIIAGIYIVMQTQPNLTQSVLAYFGGTPTIFLQPATDAAPALETENPTEPVLELSGTPDRAEEVSETPSPSPTSPPQETLTPTVTLTPTPTPLGGGFSQIAFASKRSGTMQIWVVDAAGKNLRQLTNVRDGACQPAWSPDGSRLAYISPCSAKREIYEGSSIYIANADGSGEAPLPASPEGDFDPTWSPDGLKLAFPSLRTGRASIFTIDLQTLTVQEISQSRYADLQPSWSPTSRQIAFVRKIVFGQIWIMDEEGNNQKQFSPSGEVNNFVPTWTRDGQAIFYSQIIGGSKVPGLVGMRYEDREKPREFRVPASQDVNIGPVGSVSISPDGFWMAYEGWPDGTNHDIYIMTVNGANITRLTTDPAFEFGPTWRPTASLP
ncbi:MAG TPA: protein kinase [Anaerolinea sp.]|nr:protein kinase [Anaerolinea sp.]